MVSLFILSVAGCANLTKAKIQNDNVETAFELARSQAKGCGEANEAQFRPSINTFKAAGLWLRADEISLKHKLNKNFFPPELTGDYLEAYQGATRCVNTYVAQVYALSPMHADVIFKYASKVEQSNVDLLSKNVTIGAFHTQQSQAFQVFQAEFARTQQIYLSQLNGRIQEEVDRTLKGLEDFNESRQRERAINAAQRPKITDCTVRGNRITCF